jgi:hypothetical protein
MELQVRTLFVQDERRRILRVNDPSKVPAPRFFLGRTTSGNIWRVRHDLPDSTASVLQDLAATEPVATELREAPANFDKYSETLAADAPIAFIEHGPAYYFPAHLEVRPDIVYVTASNKDLLERGFPSYLGGIEAIQPCAAVVEGEHAVSICCSARITREAAEAGVQTLEGFRSHGYATRAVAAWAIAVRRLDLIPLYSTSWENMASQGVAGKLGLVRYGADFDLT